MDALESAVLALAAEDLAPVAVPSDEGMFRLRRLCDEVKKLEDEVAFHNEKIETASGKLSKLVNFTLPEMMTELRIPKFSLDDGSSVEKTKEYYASISKDRAMAAFKWLRDEGHGGLIKNEVSVSFGKGEDEAADKLIEILDENEILYEKTEGVHPMTLKAFVREQIEKGARVERTLLGVHVAEVAKIKPPKKVKPKGKKNGN